jgi:hypothetical protein
MRRLSAEPSTNSTRLPSTTTLDDYIFRKASEIVATLLEGSEINNRDVSREALLREMRLSEYSITCSSSEIAECLAIPPKVIADASVTLTLDATHFERNGVFAGMSVSYQQATDTLDISLKQPNGETSTSRYSELSKSDPPGGRALHLIRRYLRILMLTVFPRSVALPAERKAITGFFNVFFPSLVRRTMFSFKSIRRTLNQPTQDFIEMLDEARSLEGNSLAPLSDIAVLLEEMILGGQVILDKASHRSVVPFNYSSDAGHQLQMHAAASLVRALAGFDIYLEYFAQSGDFLVVDEPEMNCHPEAQLQLIELFACLVNRGVQVVITTHSPYLLDHLNNLMELSQTTEKRKMDIIGKLKLKTAQAIIDPGKVSVYLFGQNGKVSDLLNRETNVIEAGTFGGQSEYTSNLYSEILASEE